MSTLHVDKPSRCMDRQTGEVLAESVWAVACKPLGAPEPRGIVYGFARRVDAEIALAVVEEFGREFGIDWDGPPPPAGESIFPKGSGGRKALMKRIAERLQW